MTRPRTGSEALALRRKRATTDALRRELQQRRMPRLPRPTDPEYTGERAEPLFAKAGAAA